MSLRLDAVKSPNDAFMLAQDRTLEHASDLKSLRAIFGDKCAAILEADYLGIVNFSGGNLHFFSSNGSAFNIVPFIEKLARQSRIIQDYVSSLLSYSLRSSPAQKQMYGIWQNLLRTCLWLRELKESLPIYVMQHVWNDVDLLNMHEWEGVCEFSIQEAGRRFDQIYGAEQNPDRLYQDLVNASNMLPADKCAAYEKKAIFFTDLHQRRNYLALIEEKRCAEDPAPLWHKIKTYVQLKWIHALKPNHISIQQQLFTCARRGKRFANAFPFVDFRAKDAPFSLPQPYSVDKTLEEVPKVFGIRSPGLPEFPIVAVVKSEEEKAAKECLASDFALFFGFEDVIAPCMMKSFNGLTSGFQPYYEFPSLDDLIESPDNLSDFYGELSLGAYWTSGLAAVLMGEGDGNSNNVFCTDDSLLFFDADWAFPPSNEVYVDCNLHKRMPFRLALLDFPHADMPLEVSVREFFREKAMFWEHQSWPQFMQFLETKLGKARYACLDLPEATWKSMKQRIEKVRELLYTDGSLTFRQLVHRVFPLYEIMQNMIELLSSNKYLGNTVGYYSFDQIFRKILLSKLENSQKRQQLINLLDLQIFDSARALKIILKCHKSFGMAFDLLVSLVKVCTDRLKQEEALHCLELMISGLAEKTYLLNAIISSAHKRKHISNDEKHALKARIASQKQ